jgi:hypothetical protein
MSAVILDVDQDYTTTETQDNIKETNIDFEKSEENINDLLNTNNDEKSLNNSTFNLDELDNLEYDEDVLVSNISVESNRTSELQLAKNRNNKSKEEKNLLQSRYFNKKIIENIKKNLEDEINDATTLRFTWARVATVMYCISEILMIIQTALSFTAASYQIIFISYLAGIIGVIAIGLNRFGAYSKNQSTEKTNQLNELLKTIGIHNELPDLMKYSSDKTNDHKI